MSKAKSKSRAAEVMSGGSKSKKHRPAHRINVRRAKSGGFIAENSYKPEEGDMMSPESEEHALPDMDALKAHMEQHMPEEEAEGGGEPQGDAAPPEAMG